MNTGPHAQAAADARVKRVFSDAALPVPVLPPVPSVCPSLREFKLLKFKYFTMDTLQAGAYTRPLLSST